MNEQEYMKMLRILDNYYQKDVIITWPNGLKVKCNAFHGMAESAEDDVDDEGEYYTLVNEVKILEYGSDDSIYIEKDVILIALNCIPEKIELDDGTLLWQKV